MTNYIDRDPNEMLNYAKIVESYASNMVQLIRSTQGALEYYKADLDSNSQECIEALNSKCEEFLKQVDSYHELAKQIKKKANKIIEAREIKFRW